MAMSLRLRLRRFGTALVLAVMAAAAAKSVAALHVYEPFDYPASSVLEGATATGFNLTGTYDSAAAAENQQLRVSTPGLGYGNLAGAPPTSGGKLTQLQGGGPDSATVMIARPVEILPGQAIFFSALFTFDDSSNGNHRAQIELIDGEDEIAFGEQALKLPQKLELADRPAAHRPPLFQ